MSGHRLLGLQSSLVSRLVHRRLLGDTMVSMPWNLELFFGLAGAVSQWMRRRSLTMQQAAGLEMGKETLLVEAFCSTRAKGRSSQYRFRPINNNPHLPTKAFASIGDVGFSTIHSFYRIPILAPIAVTRTQLPSSLWGDIDILPWHNHRILGRHRAHTSGTLCP